MSISPLSWTSPAMQARSLVSTVRVWPRFTTDLHCIILVSVDPTMSLRLHIRMYVKLVHIHPLCSLYCNENDISHSTVEGLYLGKRIKYELYAICNHMGGITFGHYTALVKHYATGHWYLCNDSRYAHTVLCVGIQLCGMCTPTTY